MRRVGRGDKVSPPAEQTQVSSTIIIQTSYIFALGMGLRRSKRSRMLTAIDKDVTGYIAMCVLLIS